jgi:hypothetical protein
MYSGGVYYKNQADKLSIRLISCLHNLGVIRNKLKKTERFCQEFLGIRENNAIASLQPFLYFQYGTLSVLKAKARLLIDNQS